MARQLQPPHLVRPLAGRDHPFVLKSWLRASRRAPEFRSMPAATYFRHYHAIAERILASSATRARIVAAADRPAEIYAFAVVELGPPQVLHAVYTAGWCRRFGFARAALLAAGVDLEQPLGFTFPTPMTPKLLRAHVDADGQPLAAYLGDAALWRYATPLDKSVAGGES